MAAASDSPDSPRWGLDPQVLARASEEARAKGGALPAHLDDFALAVACREGLDPAWIHFEREFKPKLRQAALALDPSGGAVELADELFSDLFGQSLFRYFHGRSSLGTWLRAVLAQRFIDRFRARRRTVPLDDEETVPAVDRGDVREDSRCRQAVRLALTTAIDRLTSRDRLLLGCYYSQRMSLAAIGRVLREHEATVSRHLTRIRKALLVDIQGDLEARSGQDAAARRACLREVMNDAGDLDLEAMIARSDAGIVHTERDRAADR